MTASSPRSHAPLAVPFALLLLVAACAVPCAPASAERITDEDHLARIEQRDFIDDAIDKGIAWLVTRQDPTEGWFEGRHRNAYTGLACIALMAAGHFPGRSEYGSNLRRGILYLAGKAQDHAYLGGDGGRMYGHGICALALAEAYGMMDTLSDNQQIRKALGPALEVIGKAQVVGRNTHSGGWRYNPDSHDADLSVTAWQILALRAAQNCGLPVPEQAISSALSYVRRCYRDQVRGFCYQPGSRDSPAMKTAGVVCMLSLGADDDENDRKMIRESADILLNVNPSSGRWFFYQSYYLATAANMMGDRHRSAFLPKLERVLVRLQRDSGEFANNGGHDGGVYSTSFAIICLAVRYQFLPIYQE